MKKNRMITIIIAIVLVLAIFVVVKPDEPEWTNVIRPGDSNYYNVQSLGDSDVPLSGGGSFVFSGEDEDAQEDSSADDGSAENSTADDGSAEDSNDLTESEEGIDNSDNSGNIAADSAETEQTDSAEEDADELVNRTVEAEIVGNAQTSGGLISRIRNMLRNSGRGSDLNKNDSIILEGMVPEDAVAEAKKEDIHIKGEKVLAAYDIKIFADEEEKEDGSFWQPQEESITVSIKSDALSDTSIVDIYHMEDDQSDAVFIGSVRTRDGEARFEAESFSVYVIAVHEGGENITPRVEFHYITKAESSASEENGTITYSADPYFFGNKAGNRQSSIILSNGERLASIEAPVSSGNSKFLGWYTVDLRSDLGTDSDEDSAIEYNWPEDMMRVDAGQEISITDNGDGTLAWSLGGSGSEGAGGNAEMDEDGCAHVGLAPIYENYCFVNFHLGSRGSNTADTILSRKLAAIGNRGTTDVLVSDITASSDDPDRRTFIGWEYDAAGEEGGSEREIIRTLDNDGKILNNREGSKGSYVTAEGSDIDLYPVFAEIRWINFNVGESHNGAAYVAPRYIYSSDNVEGEIYPADSLVTAKRTGYTFDGWYTEPDGRGVQITDGDGRVVGGTYSESGEYTDDEGNTKSGKTFEIDNGSLYVYNALERLTLYARWTPNKEAEYKVIIWKQKVTDDKNAAEEDRTYDYYTYYDRMTDDTSRPVSPDAADLRLASTDPDGAFTGFHLGRYDHDVMPDPQGTTILNVYYDRNVMEIIFNGYPDYKAISGSPNSSTQYYMKAGESYVKLIRYTSSSWFSSSTSYYYLACDGEPYTGTVYLRQRSGTQYYYSATTSYSYNSTYYGVVDGSYEQLTWTKYSGGVYYAQSSSEMTWSGLFEQTFEKNGYSWDDVAAYQWKETKTNTIQTLLTGFTHEESPYVLTNNSQGGAPAIYHYKQNEDGTYSADAAYTAYSSQTSGTFNFSNKFEGFTVAAYSTEFSSAGAGTAVREGSQASVKYPIHVYHSRNNGYSLTFTPNYPKGTDTGELDSEPVVYSGLYYEQSLSAYADQAAPEAPDNYRFDGWYMDASGTVPFDFENEIMPAGNKVVYAKWSLIKFLVRIDPAGGVMDHIDYTNEEYRRILEPTGLTSRVYNTSCATYFNNTATEYISLDEGIVRPFIEISNAEAASMETGSVYRYVNMQFIEDYGSYAADARNAVYILDTRESIDAYYNYYARVIADSGEGTAVPQALFESKYLSTERYRRLRPGENYRLLGWYETGSDGAAGNTTYDFESPTLHPTTLRASWRLEGGYTIRYTTDYTAPNGDTVTGDLETWTDPAEGGKNYVDQGETQAMQEPMAIKVNGRESDEYQFLGWQIVKVYTIAGTPRYTPLEPGVYYTAGNNLTVKAQYADDNMVIHMQAVYEKRKEAKRRPDVVQLTLDASSDAAGAGRGFIDEDAGTGETPEADSPGYISFNTDDNLYNRKPTQMLFGDYQYNTAIHLYRYATGLSVNEVTGDRLDPPGTNWFTHSEGYRLIGFDRGKADTDFIPDYAADAVISVSPGDAETLYAVWEPMVYMTFVNDTGKGDVTFNISGTGRSALHISRVDSTYGRTALDPSGSITVGKGETVRLALPEGSGETVTISGRDELGTGYSLSAVSTLGGEERQLTGTITGTDADYTRVPNGEEFGFSDTLVTDPDGITVTFTAELAPHTLVLKDNYDGNGSGGGTKEIQFSEKTDGTVYFNEESRTSYDLPSTSTRLGYEFAGWSADPESADPAYSEESGWTITDLAGFFEGEESVTLYAVWKANAEASTVYVWNEVPEPGDRDKEFNFSVSFAGKFTYQQNTNGKSSGWSANKTDTMSADNCSGEAVMEGSYSLRHGEYLKITTVKDESQGASSRPYISVSIQRFSADGEAAGDPEELSWTWSHINYDNTGASYRYRNFSFTDTDVSVTQEDSRPQYDTAVKVAAETTDYPLASDGSGRSVRWNSSFAGGTVIFSNTRRTADVTVRKVLLPASAPAEEFTFTASFIDEDGSADNGSTGSGNTDAGLQYESYRLDPAEKKMISGAAAGSSVTGEWKLEGVPTGAVLEITENVDPDRFNVRTSGTISDAGDDSDRGQSAITDLDTDNDNVFRFIVADDTNIDFTNTLKSQKIRLMVTDDSDSGTPLDSAEFTFPGIYEGTRYSAASTGIVWEGTAYAGTYRLTETGMSNRFYDKLTEPVEITISGNGISAPDSTDNISVAGPDEDGFYNITVINSRLMKVNVRNMVEADNTSGDFGFTAYISNGGRPVVRDNVTDTQGTDEEGRITFTLVHSQSVDLYVPRGSEITVEQTEDPSYYTQYQIDGGELKTGNRAGIRNIDSDVFVVFANEANPPAPTGVRSRLLPYILLACGAVVILLLRMRRRTEPAEEDAQEDSDPEEDTAEDSVQEDCVPEEDAGEDNGQE